MSETTPPQEPSAPRRSIRTTRRDFLRGMGLAAGAATMLPSLSAPADEAEATPDAAPATPGLRETGRGPRKIELRINGQTHSLTVEPRTTLLEALREHLQLTGAKNGCDRGACGACSVLLDGEAVQSCLLLAVEAVGKEVTTIEGIAADSRYARLVDAFCAHDAAQCGFCIPGMVVGSAALLNRNPHPSAADIREGLAGHLCRCATHPKIIAAVQAATGTGGPT